MKELVIFDVDNTIVKGQSQALLISFLRKKGLVSFLFYIKLMTWVMLYKLGIMKNPKPAMEYGLSFVRNRSELEVDKIIEKFFNEVLVKKIYPEAISLIKDHQSKGRHIILVSNAPNVLIKRLANYLNVSDYLSTNIEINGGIYTGKIIGDIMYGKQKLIAIKSYAISNSISLEESWAYGDHESDEYVLSEVTHPFVVNPSSQLQLIAKKNNWPVLNFKL